MKNVMLILVALFTLNLTTEAQSMKKKYRTFTVSREMPFPAEKVWAAIAEDYGSVANSHPLIVASNYTSGSLKGEKGAERMCYFNEKQTKSLHEEITDWHPEEYMLVNRVLKAERFPLDEDNTRATYKVVPNGNGSSIWSITMDYRTKPGFMGAMAKGKFKKLLSDYQLSVEHNMATGEAVTSANFKDVKKQYR